MNGITFFQHASISRSYRARGSLLRTHTNTKEIIIVFNIVSDIPKNKTLVRYLRKIIEPYSLIKISANRPLPYSKLNPDTISDSPSARSNGVRFLSAIHIIIHRRNKGQLDTILHIDSCIIIILFTSIVLKE